MTSSSKPVVLITGANTGLGLATVKALCQSPNAYEIIIGSRNEQKGKDAIKTIKTEVPDTSSTLSVVQIDVTSDPSIQSAFSLVSTQHARIDVLINNAGGIPEASNQAATLSSREIWNQTFDLNVSSAQIVTETFMPLLIRSTDPRLIFITSGTACLTETEGTSSPMHQRINAAPAAGWPKDSKSMASYAAYRSCKTGLNMVMREWCRILRNDGFKVWAVSPGFLATRLGGLGPETLKKMGAKDPSEGGEFIRDVIQGKRDHEQGKAIRADVIQAW